VRAGEAIYLDDADRALFLDDAYLLLDGHPFHVLVKMA
jgi:hypothetical protein